MVENYIKSLQYTMVVCVLQGRLGGLIMKKTINGITYDTEVSKELGSYYSEADKETIRLFLYQARHWVLCNLDADSCRKIFDAHYLIAVAGCVDNKKFHSSIFPKSQIWNDIIACFEEECDSITSKYPFLSKDDEWYINACQPARYFVDSNGNEAVVYVYCSD